MLQQEVPSRVERLLVGGEVSLEWFEANLAAPASSHAANNAAASSSLPNSHSDEPQRKKQKSQRRVEKEREYFERQQRMQENNKNKALGRKKLPCRFFPLGQCKQGSECPYQH